MDERSKMPFSALKQSKLSESRPIVTFELRKTPGAHPYMVTPYARPPNLSPATPAWHCSRPQRFRVSSSTFDHFMHSCLHRTTPPDTAHTRRQTRATQPWPREQKHSPRDFSAGSPAASPLA